MRYKRLFVEGHYYFFTVVTYQRNPILIDNIELLREAFRYAKSKFDFMIDAIVVLPEHFHTIMSFEDVQEYPKILGVVKKEFSKHCDPKYYNYLIQSHSRNQQKYKPIWQKRFYEHTIRDEKDYQMHLDYIHYNPIKHKLVESAKDWEYSSFDKFVKRGVYDKNWGDFDETIDFE
jgi:putative transposase